MLRRHAQLSSLRFGRRKPFAAAMPMAEQMMLSPELKLFAGTYAAGFLLVSLFIA